MEEVLVNETEEYDLRTVEVACAESRAETVRDSAATVAGQYVPRVVAQTVSATEMLVLGLVGIVFDRSAVRGAVADLGGSSAVENGDVATAEAAVELC